MTARDVFLAKLRGMDKKDSIFSKEERIMYLLKIIQNPTILYSDDYNRFCIAHGVRDVDDDSLLFPFIDSLSDEDIIKYLSEAGLSFTISGYIS